MKEKDRKRRQTDRRKRGVDNGGDGVKVWSDRERDEEECMDGGECSQQVL